jgi:hypothetical protein
LSQYLPTAMRVESVIDVPFNAKDNSDGPHLRSAARIDLSRIWLVVLAKQPLKSRCFRLVHALTFAQVAISSSAWTVKLQVAETGQCTTDAFGVAPMHAENV